MKMSVFPFPGKSSGTVIELGYRHLFDVLEYPQTTPALNCEDYPNGCLQLNVSQIDTSIVATMEASLDGDNWFEPMARLCITANGPYSCEWDNCAYRYIRFNWLSEAGGANALVEPIASLSGPAVEDAEVDIEAIVRAIAAARLQGRKVMRSDLVPLL